MVGGRDAPIGQESEPASVSRFPLDAVRVRSSRWRVTSCPRIKSYNLKESSLISATDRFTLLELTAPTSR